MNRREFLELSGGLIAMGASAPRFVSQTAHALAREGISFDAAQGSPILVVVQLAGGNDGLNAVVPYQDDLYYRVRPSLAVPSGEVLPLSGELGLHPSLAGFRDQFDAGRLRVLQNVGYPNPNRSHFRSMEIWESGDPDDAAPRTGWLGRYLDANCSGCDAPALTLASPLPQSLWSDHVPVPGLTDLGRLTRYGPRGPEGHRRLETLKRLYQVGQALPIDEAVRSRGFNALSAAELIREFLGGYESSVEYPNSGLARRLRNVARLIAGGMESHIYFVTHGGFDTHSNQGGLHANLLGQLADAVAAFSQDLEAMGRAEQVLILTFSEFGRRIAENGSRGTDHGAAAPMFLIGNKIKGGIEGAPPLLADDVRADVEFGLDFRRVYAAVIREWLGADPTPVVGAGYEPLGIV